MILWSQTPEGDHFCTFKGKALSSSRDPRKEARLWCDHHSFLGNFTESIIIGIGAGYHLIEMKKRWPHLSIRAYDSKPGLFASMPESLRQELQAFEKCELHFSCDLVDLSFVEISMGPVVRFQSAFTNWEEKIHEILLGQTPAALARWSEYLGYFSFVELSETVPQNLAVNIKSLPAAPEGYVKEVKVLKMLQELVR